MGCNWGGRLRLWCVLKWKNSTGWLGFSNWSIAGLHFELQPLFSLLHRIAISIAVHTHVHHLLFHFFVTVRKFNVRLFPQKLSHNGGQPLQSYLGIICTNSVNIVTTWNKFKSGKKVRHGNRQQVRSRKAINSSKNFSTIFHRQLAMRIDLQTNFKQLHKNENVESNDFIYTDKHQHLFLALLNNSGALSIRHFDYHQFSGKIMSFWRNKQNKQTRCDNNNNQSYQSALYIDRPSGTNAISCS